MRRDCLHLFPLISILLLFSTLTYGQSWSSILASSRAINWTGAGLPATLPDGETTPNPWTPPTRTQCGSTVNPSGLTNGTDVININNALAACTAGHYVLLGSGTFYIENAGNCFGGGYSCIQMYAQSGVTLRGSGAQSTKMVLSGASLIAYGISYAWSGTWTGAAQGATSLTMTSFSGSALHAGELAFLTQCNTGLSGSSCNTGSATDNGGLFVCGPNGVCSQSTRADSNSDQYQAVYVTSVTGSAPNITVNFTPGLYLSNWNNSNSPTLSWASNNGGGTNPTPYGNGLEDLTVDSTGSTYNEAIAMDYTYASWIKGVRMIGTAGGDAIAIAWTKNCLFFDNYLFGDTISSGSDTVFVQMGQSSDDLMLNNIITGGQTWNGDGGNEGHTVAYNYGRDSETSYYQLATYDHEPGSSMVLFEAEQSGLFLGDNTWGTQDLYTVFRNYLNGTDPAYSTAPNPRVMPINNYVRFENIIGNVLGGAQITTYQTNSGYNFVYQFGTTDPLALSSSMRWGNVSSVSQNSDTPPNSGVRFVSSEVPSSLSGNAAPFNNSVPSNDNLPCSFFLSGYTSTTCTPHQSGGTGLSWWKVCTSWTTFPTACATTQTQPFPPIGPDVTGGPYLSGYAYDVPASIAWHNLPIDTSYQNSYTITASSWSGGTEVLTVSGLPNRSAHIMGPFQISGTGSGTCTTGVNNECFMTSSSSAAGTISYALASNPGSLAGGTVKFPDVRQFDERVYENDPSGNPPPPAPTGLQVTVH
jgi:hypothetical protein